MSVTSYDDPLEVLTSIEDPDFEIDDIERIFDRLINPV